MFYLVPVEQSGPYRGPRYLRWRCGAGLAGQWSLKDFGPCRPVALVAARSALRAPDVVPLSEWTAKTRATARGYLRNAGIDAGWAIRAQTWREGVHRLVGLTQAYQAGRDETVAWLGRPVHFGWSTLAPLDMTAYARELAEQARRVISPLKVRGIKRLDWRDVLGLLARVPLIALMALPATDAFTTVSNQALTTYSASWSLNSGNFQVDASDVVVANASAECGAFWNADAFNGNHYAFITRTAVGTDWLGPGTRHAGAGTASYYGFYTQGTGAETYLFKMVTGTWTQLGSAGSVNIVANDVLRLESNGTTHTPIRNGSTYTSIGAQTDSALSGGAAGLSGYGLATLANAGDNWEGGNLGAAAASFLPRQNAMAHMIVR